MNDTVNDDCADLGEARQGIEAAFERLYGRHAAVILSLCRRATDGRNGAEAEDALQETFIRAFRKLDDIHDCHGFRTWLYRIARLVCSERRRSRTRRHRHEGVAMQYMTQMNASAESDAVRESTGAERSEQLARLSSALDQLPDDERLAIHLYYLDADPVLAAQSALGLGRSGFYKLLARARAALATQLREAVQS